LSGPSRFPQLSADDVAKQRTHNSLSNNELQSSAISQTSRIVELTALRGKVIFVAVAGK
jgi:hypothetical protein